MTASVSIFGTKAETLARLAPLLRCSRVLPMVYFRADAWSADRADQVERVLAQPWASGRMVVRSSAILEDSFAGSQAGRFHTELGVHGREALMAAVERVLASYGEPSPEDQVLIQPELTEVTASGVACSCEPSTGSPYRVINWSEGSSTRAVTNGSAGIRTWYGVGYEAHTRPSDGRLRDVLALLAEVVALTGHDRCEIEFGFGRDGLLYLFQARPLVVGESVVDAAEHRRLLRRVAADLAAATGRAQGPRRAERRILGEPAIFGVMPDWNPAELIGVRPRALAASLYRLLITDRSWARARARYGYRDLTGIPLMVDFAGLPYVDVRASFTSLIPADLDDDLAARLVSHYLRRLAEAPHLHDKVEFRIVLSCNTPGLASRLRELGDAGFAAAERAALRDSLTRLTNALVGGRAWREDLLRVARLADQAPSPGPPENDDLRALAAALRRCVIFGARPFAGLARAGFVAMELLNALVSAGVLSDADSAALLASLNTVAARIGHDFAALDRAEFLRRYGHLRPGTYDILSSRYDEEPERYFAWSSRRPRPSTPVSFRPDPRQLREIDRLLHASGFTVDAAGLLGFVAEAVRGREEAKFVFTGVLSEALVRIRRLGENLGLSAEEMSHVPIADVLALGGDQDRDRAALRAAANRGLAEHNAACAIFLPPIIRTPDEVYAFEVPESVPNFVTRRRVLGRVADVDRGDSAEGAIALVTSADPGYDWLLTHGIVGLVTAYGGANSHMAIRAQELGIPAVIGVGEARLRMWAAAGALDVDCAGRLVRALP
ncbi:PEP-utilizing enzyme [Dactylosporangium sp. CA-139066]|uniref:PEP-utilizing enzyme n=1 Tax=Dactylosporangium sp. CA-139066 TaxID=3239930 RepID=UPI003D9119AB